MLFSSECRIAGLKLKMEGLSSGLLLILLYCAICPSVPNKVTISKKTKKTNQKQPKKKNEQLIFPCFYKSVFCLPGASALSARCRLLECSPAALPKGHRRVRSSSSIKRSWVSCGRPVGGKLSFPPGHMAHCVLCLCCRVM